MPEPMPVKEFIDELNSQWVANNVTKPQLIEVTGETNDPLRFNLNVNDVLFGRAGDPAQEETPIGNWKYGNRLYRIELEIQTNANRQRLYDLVKEVRRICHARMHNLTNFQRIRFMSFSESTQEEVNVWKGSITIQLENNAILLETT